MKALVGTFNQDKALIVNSNNKGLLRDCDKRLVVCSSNIIPSSQDDEADLRAGARCQDQDCIRKLHHNTPTADNSTNNRETLLH